MLRVRARTLPVKNPVRSRGGLTVSFRRLRNELQVWGGLRLILSFRRRYFPLDVAPLDAAAFGEGLDWLIIDVQKEVAGRIVAAPVMPGPANNEPHIVERNQRPLDGSHAALGARGDRLSRQ